MSFVYSAIQILIPLIIVLIISRFVIVAIKMKFNLFEPIEALIYRKNCKKLIDILTAGIGFILFIVISTYTNVSDVQLGIIIGLYYGIVSTILELIKTNVNN